MSSDKPAGSADGPALVPVGDPALLVARIGAGDEAAEDELARRYRPRIYAMLVARTRDPELARDLTQETLLAALGALRAGRIREPDRLGAFLHGTARNVVNNFFRTRPREASLDDLPAEASADPTSAYEDAERVALVRRALLGLEAVDRVILALTLVEGLKPGAIARRLRLAPELVRTRKSRAIKRVAEQLQGRHGT